MIFQEGVRAYSFFNLFFFGTLGGYIFLCVGIMGNVEMEGRLMETFIFHQGFPVVATSVEPRVPMRRTWQDGPR